MSSAGDNPTPEVSSRGLLVVATLVSGVIIGLFIYLAISRSLFSRPINEIGDTLAGFAGLLAFLWLIVTVLLQITELRLQRHEISGLKASAEDQATSLKNTLRIHALTFQRSQEQQIEPFIFERRDAVLNQIVDFIEKYQLAGHASEYVNDPIAGVKVVLAYFVDPGFAPTAETITVEELPLKEKFDYDAYLALTSILYSIHESWIVCKPIYAIARDADNLDAFKAWTVRHKIAWYQSSYANLYRLSARLEAIIARGGIASKTRTLILQRLKEDENLSNMDIPFQ